MTTPRRLLALSAAIGLAAVLSACATGTATDPSGAPDASTGVDTEIEVNSAWLDSGRIIALVTSGSSSCIPTAGDVTLEDDGTLAVELVEPAETTPCTRDLVDRVTLVSVPSGVDPAADLPIVVTGVGYTGSTELAGVAGLDPSTAVDPATPSAGWTHKDGVFAILTYGSSSCPPVIASTEVTGPTEVTVTVETPPADQVCTMDYTTRGTLAYAEGLTGVEGVELVLTGSPEFTDLRLPIYGVNAD